jgi:hypothetical protein
MPSSEQSGAVEPTTPEIVKPSPAGTNYVCPYCGGRTSAGPRCDVCRGLLDALSRQATQNSMGPWFVRDEAQPFRPGCSFETLIALVRRGKIALDTIIRGPSTMQFWAPARRVPGVAHHLGICFNCAEEIEPTDHECRFCGADFHADPDRQHLGLAPMLLIPGQASPDQIAASTMRRPVAEPTQRTTVLKAVPRAPERPAAEPAQAAELAPDSGRIGPGVDGSARARSTNVYAQRTTHLNRTITRLKLAATLGAILGVFCVAALVVIVADRRLSLNLGVADAILGAADSPPVQIVPPGPAPSIPSPRQSSDTEVGDPVRPAPAEPQPSVDPTLPAATPPAAPDDDMAPPAAAPSLPPPVDAPMAVPADLQLKIQDAEKIASADTVEALEKAIEILETLQDGAPDIAKAKIGVLMIAYRLRIEQIKLKDF